MLLRRFILCTCWLLGTCTVGTVRADPLKELTFIEVRSNATERCRALLRHYAESLRQLTPAPAVLVLEEAARPEKFALLEADDRADDAATAQGAQLLQPLTGLLTAPLDRRTHREFGDAEPPPATAGPGALYVIAHLDIAPPDRAKGESALRQLASRARSSPGNLRFEVWQQTDRTNHFNIVAVWSSRGRFNDFAAGPAAREFRDSVASLLGSPYDERFYRRAD